MMMNGGFSFKIHERFGPSKERGGLTINRKKFIVGCNYLNVNTLFKSDDLVKWNINSCGLYNPKSYIYIYIYIYI